MATTPGALNKAIIARLRDTESPALTGDQASAQDVTKAITWRWGTLRQVGTFPTGTFYDDVGVEAMPRAVDVGILEYAIRRFEIWHSDGGSDFFYNQANALELLFDYRRGAPEMPIGGDGRMWYSTVFTPLQGPFHNDDINAWYGLMAFQFVESRP